MSLSNNNILDLNEKINLLFNNYLGFTSTDETKPYYDETETYNNYVIGDDIFIDNIPKSPLFVNNGVFNDTCANEFIIYSKSIKDISFSTIIYDISINHNKSYDIFTNDSVQKFNNSDGMPVVLKFNRLKLTRLKGLNDENMLVSSFNALYNTTDINYTDNSYINLLEDTIQFNYHKTNTLAPYQWYIEYYNGSKYVNVSSTEGSNIFDIKSGIVTFYDWNTSAFSSDMHRNNTIDLTDISNNLYITFVKYIGKKGITNLGITNTQNQSTVNTLNINTLDVSGSNITLLYNQTDQNDISGAGIKITNSGLKSFLYYSNDDKWTTGSSNLEANTFIGDLSGNSIISNCIKGNTQYGSITIKKNNLLSDFSLNGDIIIYPNNYDISRQALYGNQFLIKANINYKCSVEANKRIQFFIEKSNNNIDFNNIYQTCYLGPKNAGGPFKNIVNIELFDDEITVGNTYYYKIGYKLENDIKFIPYGIIGLDDIEETAYNLIMIQEYSN